MLPLFYTFLDLLTPIFGLLAHPPDPSFAQLTPVLPMVFRFQILCNFEPGFVLLVVFFLPLAFQFAEVVVGSIKPEVLTRPGDCIIHDVEFATGALSNLVDHLVFERFFVSVRLRQVEGFDTKFGECIFYSEY